MDRNRVKRWHKIDRRGEAHLIPLKCDLFLARKRNMRSVQKASLMMRLARYWIVILLKASFRASGRSTVGPNQVGMYYFPSYRLRQTRFSSAPATLTGRPQRAQAAARSRSSRRTTSSSPDRHHQRDLHRSADERRDNRQYRRRPRRNFTGCSLSTRMSAGPAARQRSRHPMCRPA